MAVAAAMGAGVPWVLDPVMIDRAPSRRAAARRLVAQGPDVLRLNEAERAALFDRPGAPDFSGVLAVSGETDRLSRGERRVEIANGHPLMARITGAGCLLGALTGAFLAVEPDPLEAAVAANLTLGIAGERAGARSTGPGSFQVAMLDALAALAPADIESQARIPCAL
jgi:hydroxyethylthiazole kinase